MQTGGTTGSKRHGRAGLAPLRGVLLPLGACDCSAGFRPVKWRWGGNLSKVERLSTKEGRGTWCPFDQRTARQYDSERRRARRTFPSVGGSENRAKEPVKALRGIIQLIRPLQWAKNVLVLAGVVFSLNLTRPVMLGRALVAFVCFCLLSAAGYAFNDLKDMEGDRRHPDKSNRPLPSGAISRATAVVVCVVTLVAGLVLALWLGGPWAPNPWVFLILAVSYVVLTFAYSLYLKHVVIVDLLCIAGCFVLRAGAGAAALPVYMSSWLFACTLLLALFVAAGRRRAELVLLQEDAVNHRRVSAEYTPQLLDQIIAIVTGATLISYVLYTMWDSTVERFGSDNLKYTVPFVLYGLFRYLYRIYRHEEGGQPEATLFRDVPMLVNLALYAISVLVIIYLNRHMSIHLP